jgi:hypothetical protein
MTQPTQAFQQIPQTPADSGLTELTSRIRDSKHVTLVGALVPALIVPCMANRPSDGLAGHGEIYESLTIFLAATSWPISYEASQEICRELVPDRGFQRDYKRALMHPHPEHPGSFSSQAPESGGLGYMTTKLKEIIGKKTVEVIVSGELDNSLSSELKIPPQVAKTDTSNLYRAIEIRLYPDRRLAHEAMTQATAAVADR